MPFNAGKPMLCYGSSSAKTIAAVLIKEKLAVFCTPDTTDMPFKQPIFKKFKGQCNERKSLLLCSIGTALAYAATHCVLYSLEAGESTVGEQLRASSDSTIDAAKL